MTEIGIRPGKASDVPFLMRRTLKDLRNMDFARAVSNDLYYTYAHRALEHVFTQSLVRVAYPSPTSVASGVRSGDPNRILAYIACQPSNLGLIVHYINTRRSVDEKGRQTESYREQGIARKLVESVIRDYDIDPEKPLIYTLRTAMFRYNKPFREYVDQHPDRFQHNPFLFFTLLPEGWETGVKKRKPSEVEWRETSAIS